MKVGKKQSVTVEGMSLLQLDNPLNLSKTDGPSLVGRLEKAQQQRQERYKQQYGNDWFSHYWEDVKKKHGYWSEEKDFNTLIYYGTPYNSSSPHAQEERKRWDAYVRAFYGDRYEELRKHKPDDPVVNEMLLLRAFQTGKWEDLPDVLQHAYHERMRGQ